MAATGVTDLSLADAATLIASREASPVELVDACLERIAETDDELRAYISVFDEEARVAARAAETGEPRGPLHGIPVALKDNIALAGHPTTAGSTILADWIPSMDAPVASRLKDAGAIVIGKTNLHEFTAGITTENPHYGSCRNPWATARSPGGSSGGSAAAVAARTCFGALGTDTGGSIRIPSSLTGLAGIRPTIGRIETEGLVPLAWSVDTVGPMTRTVLDCALMFDVLTGARTDLSRAPLRIGVLRGSFEHLQPAVRDALDTAVETFRGLGTTIDEVDLAHLELAGSALVTVITSESSAYHRRWLCERPDDYGDDVRFFLELGCLQPAQHYVQAQRYRSLLRAEALQSLERVDAILTPALPFTAFRVGARTVEIEPGAEEDLFASVFRFVGPSSLTGLPALAVPCGFDADGLPIGMQLIGRPFEEETLFQAGAAFQEATDFHQRSPAI